MKRKLWLAGLLLLGLSLTGMGNMDQKPSGEIPLADREVSAVVVDKEGITLTLIHFSINGQTMLSGRLGAGKATIPFSRIKEAIMFPEPKGLQVRIELTDHPPLTLALDRGLTVYGQAPFGTYQVSLEQLKKFEIRTVTEKKK